ncbi:hypothetical protein C0989_007311 [Termitomyces sp. Mn162]|nr:hypothetical protein C0989_007311 [Termitomyces sp. Mn162]
MAEGQVKHWRVTYNDIHNLIRGVTPKLAQDFNPDLMRTFLREITENKALQIQAIGLSLYEPLPGTSQQQIGKEVVRTQWIYALTELRKDVEEELTNHPESERETLRAATKFAIFVVHNKAKPKLAELPEGIS